MPLTSKRKAEIQAQQTALLRQRRTQPRQAELAKENARLWNYPVLISTGTDDWEKTGRDVEMVIKDTTSVNAARRALEYLETVIRRDEYLIQIKIKERQESRSDGPTTMPEM